MAFFRLDVRRGVHRFLRDLEDVDTAVRLDRCILGLADEPVPDTAVNVNAVTGLYCLYFESFAILYRVYESESRISVYTIESL